MAEQIYHIHNMSRSVYTRTQRWDNSERAKAVLRLGGGLVRVVRGRATPVTESLMRKLQAELIAKSEAGALRVTLPSGQPVDVTTLKPVGVSEKPAPLPNPPEDSAQDDKNEGVGDPKPVLRGNVGQGVDLAPPQLGNYAAREESEAVAEEEAPPEDAAAAEEVGDVVEVSSEDLPVPTVAAQKKRHSRQHR